MESIPPVCIGIYLVIIIIALVERYRTRHTRVKIKHDIKCPKCGENALKPKVRLIDQDHSEEYREYVGKYNFRNKRVVFVTRYSFGYKDYCPQCGYTGVEKVSDIESKNYEDTDRTIVFEGSSDWNDAGKNIWWEEHRVRV